MKSTFIYILLTILLSSSVSLSANTDAIANGEPADDGAAGVIALADSAFAKGEYAEALALYNKVAESAGVSSELWYNMGNAYSKGGFYGKAMVCYHRALRLDPQNKQAETNIKYIENKVADNNRAEVKGRKMTVDADSRSFFSNVRLFICRDHLSNTWAVWAVVFYLLLMGCITFYVFSSSVPLRKIGFFGGFAMLGITVIFMVFAFMAASYKSDEGVIIEGKVKLLSEPSASAKETAVALTRGTRMTVLDSIPVGEGKAEWYKVRLNSDFVGWIAADNFECIDY